MRSDNDYIIVQEKGKVYYRRVEEESLTKIPDWVKQYGGVAALFLLSLGISTAAFGFNYKSVGVTITAWTVAWIIGLAKQKPKKIMKDGFVWVDSLSREEGS